MRFDERGEWVGRRKSTEWRTAGWSEKQKAVVNASAAVVVVVGCNVNAVGYSGRSWPTADLAPANLTPI